MKSQKDQLKSNREYQERRRRKLGILTREEKRQNNALHFITLSNEVHNDKYDYSVVEYHRNDIKVQISCPTHGIFQQTPSAHSSSKQGCPTCAAETRRGKCGKERKTTNQFITDSNIQHSNKYTYLHTIYVNIKLKVLITCSTHGDFLQTPKAHLRGQGCPDCANIQRASFFESKGERVVEQYLIKHDIPYMKQKTFPDCKHKMLLRFDFYLPNHNILIEYDGEQHYKFTPKFHGTIEKFKECQLRDNIKTDYTKANHIQLIRIKWCDSVRNILAIIDI